MRSSLCRFAISMKLPLVLGLLFFSYWANCAPRKVIQSNAVNQNIPSSSNNNKEAMDDKTMMAKHRGLLAWLGGFNPITSVSNLEKGNNVPLTNKIISAPLKDEKSTGGIAIANESIPIETSQVEDLSIQVFTSNDPKLINQTLVKRNEVTDQAPKLTNESDPLVFKPLNVENTIHTRPIKTFNTYESKPTLQHFSTHPHQQSRFPHSTGFVRRPNAYMEALYGKRKNKNQKNPAVLNSQFVMNSPTSGQDNIRQKQSGQKKLFINPNENYFHTRNPNLGRAPGNRNSPQLPITDLTNLPRAKLYPGGKCTNLSINNKADKSIGFCRHISNPCLASEEAISKCGRYYKCCTQRNATIPHDTNNSNMNHVVHNQNLKQGKAPENSYSKLQISTTDTTKFPRAKLYPGGGCTNHIIDNNAEKRIGLCRPISNPCHPSEEATSICGRYYKCCIPRNDAMGNDKHIVSHNHLTHQLNLKQGTAPGNRYPMPQIPITDAEKLPKAKLYPGGRCTNSVGENADKRIGLCRPISNPCLTTEEATSICGRYYKCCIPKNDTMPMTGGIKVSSQAHKSPTNTLTSLPRAVVYPRGKCKLLKELPNYQKIGNCRPSHMQCHLQEEAPEICNNYFKCCVASTNTDHSSNDNKKSGILKDLPQSLPYATMFPRGMCRISGQESTRIGSCVPGSVGCGVLYNRGAAGVSDSELEPVALCPRRYNFQNEMICCAPKIKDKSYNQSNTRENTTQEKKHDIDKTINTPILEKLIVPNISLL